MIENISHTKYFCINSVFNRKHIQPVLDEVNHNYIFGITILEALSKLYLSIQDIIILNYHDLTYGTGKLWISPVYNILRIRTSETSTSTMTPNTNINMNNSYINRTNTPST